MVRVSRPPTGARDTDNRVGAVDGSLPGERRRFLLAVGALTALGALVRFATLDQQSFWLDELVTVSLVRGDFDDMLRAIPKSEATPYMYYVLAWPWSRVLGLGEVGLRSLSALVGTAVVPVACAAGAVLISRRAGLIAAALVSVNPFLVWYAQEARAYSLVALLAALSFLFFACALRGMRGALLGWALASSLALASHYFAFFLVAPEALWLLYRLGPERRVAIAMLPPVVVLAAHVPLVLDQRGNAEAVAGTALASRIAGIPKALVVGYSFPAELAGSLVAAALVVVALVLLVTRTAPMARRGALLAGGLAVVSCAVPLVVAFLGTDFVIARNFVAAIVPGAVCLAAGYAATRAGIVAATALCLLTLGITLTASLDQRYGRTDWRGVGEVLASTTVERAVVVTPYMSRSLWAPYLAGLREPAGGRTRVEEVAVVGLATEGGFSTGAVAPPRGAPPAPPRGFELVEHREAPTYTFVVYRAGAPVWLSTAELFDLALGGEQPGVLVQAP
jgi:hypothetical protein